MNITEEKKDGRRNKKRKRRKGKIIKTKTIKSNDSKTWI